MPSDEVAREVARKLRYYMQVERLEDGFDLTGPEIPRRHYEQKRRPPLYSGATLHDKSLKFYFRDDSIKHFLRDLSPAPAKKAPKSKKRRKAHVNNLEYHMAQAEFREPLDGIPTGQRPQSLAYKTNVKRPRPGSAFSTGLSTLRRTTPVSVSPQEAHRIVNTAAKLLVATETVAFNSGALQRSSSARPDARAASSLRLPDVNNKPKKQKRKQRGRKSSQYKSKTTTEEEPEEQLCEPSQEEEKDDPFLENIQTYQITVYTGNKRGLVSEASVKLKIHGSSMETNWIKLTDSQMNEVKFQKNQKDIFTMETEKLGDLVAVSIGHNKAAPGCNWFLDKIEVADLKEEKTYVFENNDWIPHSKTASIGMKKLHLSRVVGPSQAEVLRKASREDPASDLPSSSLSTPKSAEDGDSTSQKSRSRSPSSSSNKSQSRSRSTSSSRSSRSRSSSPNTVVSKSSSRSSTYAEKESDNKENDETIAVVPIPPAVEAQKSPSVNSEEEQGETTASIVETQAPVPTDAAAEISEKDQHPGESSTVTPEAAVGEENEEVKDDNAAEYSEQAKSDVAVAVDAPGETTLEIEGEQEKHENEKEEKEEAGDEPKLEDKEEAGDEPKLEGKEEAVDEEPVASEEAEQPVEETEVPDEVDQKPVEENKLEENEETSDKAKGDTSSMSSEDGFLDELNLIKNPKFVFEDKQPEFWIQYGGCSLNCVEVTVPFSDNKFACEVTNRSATFSGIAQNLAGEIEDFARYKITAQVRLGDSSPSASDKIQCVLQYKLDQVDSRFQQMKITEVVYAKATSWSYLVGWIEMSLIQKNHKISAARLCFEGPAQDVDFMVTNVKLSQEVLQGSSDQANIIKNGTFDQFTLTPKDWKGVGQAIIGFSNMSHSGKRGCMTIERPFAYSGIAQSVLDIVEHCRHYSFTAYVRLVDTPPEQSHTVRWVLKYNAGDSKGDLRHIISHAENVTSKSWVKMNGELNMLEIKSSTGRPVLSASIHKFSGTRHKDDFGAPLEYCTYHFETTPNVNLCVAGPRMIDGGKIAKPALTNGTATTATVVSAANEDKAENDKQPESDSSSTASSNNSDEEKEAEKKDEEKKIEKPVDGIVATSEVSHEEKTSYDTVDKLESLPVKPQVNDEFSELKKLHAAVERGDIESIISIIRNKPLLINLADSETKFTTAHVAAVNRKGPVLKVLSEFGVDFNATSKSGYMAIHYAALNNDVDVLSVLHSLGASLNELTLDRHTPLHVAAKQGNKETVKWLLINGCVLNYRDNLDRTPADMASLYGHETIAALIMNCVGLLKQNRDIIDTINNTDLYSTPVYPYGPPRPDESSKKESSDKPFSTDSNQNDDDMLVDKLHAAIASDKTTEIQSLLEKHPQLINLPSRKGLISIHVATDCRNPQLVRILSRMGAELSQPTTSGYFPLHQAVLNDDIPTLNALFALGVSLNAMTPDRQTALHLAAERGMLPLVKWLISNGAILNHRNSKHETPAEVAANAGFNNITNLIKECVAKLKSGQDVADVLKVY